MRIASLLLSFLLAALLLVGSARAETAVRVVETWPLGDDVALAGNQNFYIRFAYKTDKPVRIWARPYFHGEPAKAGSNPSQQYTGSGETFGWFFLMEPGAKVDEVRITAGDGSIAGTPVVGVHLVRVTGGGPAYDARNDPAWVVAMNANAELEQRKAYEASMNAPVKPGEVVLFAGFMLAVYAVGFLSFALPAWALWKWRGGWRIAAVAPAALMAFVALRIVVDTSRDPTSHNLWPFEILMSGAVAVLAMAVLMVARRIAGVGGGTTRSSSA